MKACNKCEHQRTKPRVFSDSVKVCTHETAVGVIDIIHGRQRIERCEDCRKDDKLCGIEGIYYKERGKK